MIGAASIPTPAAREVLSQQPLDDQAAEGVTDDDRLGVEAGDDARVMLDDVVDAVTGHAFGLAARLLDRVASPGQPGAVGA